MLPLRLVIFLSAWLVPTRPASLSGRRQYDYGSDVHTRFQKRQGYRPPIVTGLPSVDGHLPARREIRELEKDEDLWNLFLLALSWMQYTDQDVWSSWYKIAGIHGAPGQTWGGVEAIPGNDNIGYCHHVSILFPTWHRPYLALYEQILYNIVQYIASLYPPEKREHIGKAAKSFRLPYWDWAATPQNGTGVLPLSMGGHPNIAVSGPNGVQTIANPLFSYTFKPFNASIFPELPFNTWNETKRAPRPINSPAATSNNSFVARALDSQMPSFQQRLYNLFANYPNYTSFSNEAWIPTDDNGTYDSIEALHDSIHTLGGGAFGHLSIIQYSAFDPLFLLHHVNVDRIFAMWQVLYNDSYVVPMPAIYPSHTSTVGQIQDTETALTPFFSDNGVFWTSDTVRDHEVFGYTYPEVSNKNRAEVVASINRLYTHYSPATIAMTHQWRQSRGYGNTAVADNSRSRPDAYRRSLRLPVDAVFDGEDYYEWIANIRVKKDALNDSFMIHLFLGTVPGDPSTWTVASNLVGTLGVFAHSGPHGKMGQRHIAGTIPMTSALLDAIAARKIVSLRPRQVEPFLKSQLRLRISLLTETVVSPEEVDGLGVSIVSSRVRAPASETRLVKWGDVESHFDLFV
ncbi:hypothetical protein DL765_001336 [Monosporascus sp. GIB2]|nr:hypothetical protein DL765_001336 [Monosporascus sp. GIB2]